MSEDALPDDQFARIEAPLREQLDRIGRTIGYGRACQLLGELWDDLLERDWNVPRGRGRMERRPDIEIHDAAIAKIRELERNVRKLIELKLAYQASIEELRNKHDAETIRWREFNQMTLARVGAAEARVAELEQQFAERAEAFEHSMQAARQQLSAEQERADSLSVLLRQEINRGTAPSAADVAEAVRLAQAFQNSADWLLKGEQRKPFCGAGDMLSAAALLLRLAGNPTQETPK